MSKRKMKRRRYGLWGRWGEGEENIDGHGLAAKSY